MTEPVSETAAQADRPKTTRPGPLDPDGICTGMDVPSGPWTAEDVAYWTGTARYQPWKDVAAFFMGSEP